MTPFQLHVLTAVKPFYEGECVSLVIPTPSGLYGIQAKHSNFVGSVIPGEMKITLKDGQVLTAAVADGIVKVEDGDVLVLVDTAERPEEIDETRARRALEKAMEDTAKERSTREYYAAQARLARAINRLKVKTHKRR